MDRKVVFLDIDGTLMDFDGTIPNSTGEAIKRARKNGHLMVICSGRSLYQIQSKVLDLGIDGIVGSAGSFVILNDREIYRARMKQESLERLLAYFEENDFVYMAQTSKGAVATQRSSDRLWEIYRKTGLPEDRADELLGEYCIREDMKNHEGIEKFIFHESPFPVEEVKKALSDEFYVTEFSFNMTGTVSGEIGIGGINKSTGMKIFLESVGVSLENTIGIGDGPNDFEMIETAHIGVAMGNAVEPLKAIADFVTKPIKEDGIYYAFEQLGLI